MNNTDDKVLKGLLEIDTPTVTNAVATYPENPDCLGLYNPWYSNWYTDDSLRCMYPELGARVGYAVTCVYGMPDPDYPGLSFMDVIDAMEASPKPVILALQQNYPPELQAKVGLLGGLMVNSMKAMGCVGVVSNGPSRDIDEIRPLDFQLLLSGATPGHGKMAVHAVNVPVSISGMDVAPGEMIHMDENGACKFPAARAGDVLDSTRRQLEAEAEKIAKLRKAKTAAEIKAAWGVYGK